MAPLRRLVTAIFVSMSAVTFALPNHTPDAPGVLHLRAPNHTPDAPGVLHQRQPEPTPSAPGLLLHARRPSDVPAYRQLAGRQASTITGAAPTATGAAPSATPAMQIEQLVAGIGFNIMAQKAQIAVVSIMQNLGNAPAVPDANNMLYKVAKDDLLSFMGAGMRIRGNNMQLSGVNPQITRGLAQLEEQQVLQMAMANNLTGDATKDGPMLQTLQSGFEGAIQKNMGLQSLATGGSSVPMMTKAAEV